MFGLTFEKLFLVAVVAGFVLGPHRLPEYAHRLSRTVRTLRGFIESARVAAEREAGIPLDRTEWQSWNLRQYDPRRIVGDALATSEPVADVPVRRMRPGRRYVVPGSPPPHPIRIDDFSDDDSQRVAARTAPLDVPPTPRDETEASAP